MKAKRLIPGKVLNPLYDPKAHRKAVQSRTEYDQPKFLDVDAGFVHSGGDAWILCCPGYMNSAASCEPADDECSAAVREWMTSKRPQELQRLQMLVDNVSAIKDPQQREHISKLAKAYGLRRGGDGVATVDPAPVVAEVADDKPKSAKK